MTAANVKELFVGIPAKVTSATPPLWNAVSGNIVFLSIGALMAKFMINTFDSPSRVSAAWLRLGDYTVVFVLLICIYACNISVMLNSIRARRLAHVDRPDQHVYASAKPKTDGPREAILLVNDDTGVGQFNRAQRAMFNMHETQPLYLAASIACSLIAPRTVTILVIGYAVSRVLFAIGYTSKPLLRFIGFMPSVIIENTTMAFVAVLALKHLSSLGNLPQFCIADALQ